jgi:hypothetical protein
MSYIRVLPRDLFNEANLLKCLGALWIAVDGKGPAAQFDVESVEHFDIRQDPNDGSIFVANLPFSMGGRRAHLSRPLNSRNPWPLYISFPDYPEIDVAPVFADDGKLSVEFTLLIITAVK